MLGYTKEKMLGKPFLDFIHPDDQENIFKIFIGAFEDPDTQKELEFRVRKKDGKYIYLYSKPTIIIANGLITGFNAIVNEITDRKRAEEAQQNSEQFLQNVFDAIQDGISVLDTDLY
jgi:PAS domain S-box-containing protein